LLILVLALSGACAISQVVEAGTTVPAAEFEISDLAITPTEVSVGKSVTISANITNKSTVDGNYEATLKINGITEEAKALNVPPKSIKTISFIISRDAAATYEVDVDGLKGSFTVSEKPAATAGFPTLPVVGGVIGAAAVAGLLAFLLLKRRAVKP